MALVLELSKALFRIYRMHQSGVWIQMPGFLFLGGLLNIIYNGVIEILEHGIVIYIRNLKFKEMIFWIWNLKRKPLTPKCGMAYFYVADKLENVLKNGPPKS